MLEENIKEVELKLNKKLEVKYNKPVAENGTLVISLEEYRHKSWSIANEIEKGWDKIVIKSDPEILKYNASIGEVELVTKWLESLYVMSLSYSNKVTFEIIGNEINPGNQLYINLLTRRYREVDFIITAKVPMLVRSYDEFEGDNQKSLIRAIALFFAQSLI